jgi:hypothetical protein
MPPRQVTLAPLLALASLVALALALPAGPTNTAGAVAPQPCGLLPASGQSTSNPANKNDGNPSPVPVPDDGAVRAGAPLSYTDNGDGTITDHNTGLMWENKTDDGGLRDKDNVYRWSGDGSQETIWDWIDDLNTQGGTGFAGHNDWRIPNIKELQSIRDYATGGSARSPFVTKPSYYWSSTTVAHFPWAAWTVFFTGGGDMILYDKQAQEFYVRAVRGPVATIDQGPECQRFPATGQTKAYRADKNDGVPRAVRIPDDGTVEAGAPLTYRDNGDGTITDKNTGLIWEKKGNAGGLHDRDEAFRWSGDGSQETIWDWLDDVNSEGGTGFAGHDDWRIPNIKELISIVDYGRADPSIDQAFSASCAASRGAAQSCTVPSKYWASTGPTFAQFSVSYVVRDSFPSLYFVRAVRGGTTAASTAASAAPGSGGSPSPPSAQSSPTSTPASPCSGDPDCARFPATGWTTPVPANKNDGIPGPVPVPDDGTLKAGAPLSFTDNGDGTITDTNTGLLWEKKSNDGGLHDKDNMYRWSGDGSHETIWDWIDDLNSEGGTGFAGHDDWRVPNVRELTSIVHYGQRAPSVHPAFNSGCSPGSTVTTGSCTPLSWLFTSTTMKGWPDGAWMIGTGGVGHVYLGDKVQPLAVRAVRGQGFSQGTRLPATGQTVSHPADKNDGVPHPVAVPDDGALELGPPLSYTDNGDGTITDTNTGLTWEDKDNAGGLHDKDNTYAWSGDGSQETIWDWIEDVNGESGSGFAGHNDWRIPNVKEFLSIVDYGRLHPSIDPAFTSHSSSHRSGTAISPSISWHVAFDFGWISREVLDLPLSARAVRGGDLGD